LSGSLGKSQKEGQDDQGWIQEAGGTSPTVLRSPLWMSACEAPHSGSVMLAVCHIRVQYDGPL